MKGLAMKPQSLRSNQISKDKLNKKQQEKGDQESIEQNMFTHPVKIGHYLASSSF
jgi:hypothetical protein